MLKIIRLPKTIQKTGLSRSTIYGLVKSRLFPKQIKLSPRTMGFIEGEVDAIINARIAGKSEEEIKALVIELEEARSKIGAEV